MSFWDLASVILKLVNLSSIAVVLGGGFSFMLVAGIEPETRMAILRYVRSGAVVGLISTTLFFLIQIGGINQSGLVGMLDFQMGKIVADSGLGYSTALRLLSYVCILLVTTALSSSLAREFSLVGVSIYLSSAVYIVAALQFSVSFSFTGHTANLGLIAHIALTTHVLSAFMWVGSLYPLRLVTGTANQSYLKTVMENFGQVAVFIVGTLLLSGLYLATQLLNSIDDLVRTAYGTSFSLKLIGVAAILTLAASNKFFIVPNLTSASRIRHLREYVSLELVVAIFIIGITSYFTTVVGVSHG